MELTSDSFLCTRGWRGGKDLSVCQASRRDHIRPHFLGWQPPTMSAHVYAMDLSESRLHAHKQGLDSFDHPVTLTCLASSCPNQLSFWATVNLETLFCHPRQNQDQLCAAPALKWIWCLLARPWNAYHQLCARRDLCRSRVYQLQVDDQHHHYRLLRLDFDRHSMMQSCVTNCLRPIQSLR